MPDVNLQYVIAVALVDGALSFESSHSYERMQDPRVRAVQARVELVADRVADGSGGAAQRPRGGDACATAAR